MFKFNRPRMTTDGQKLFYLEHYDRSNPRFRLADSRNILIQLKLYQWCMSEEYHSPVNKAKLVTYKTHQQINKTRDGFTTTKMHWRFFHQLDMRFGLEYLIYLWLPRLMAMEGGPVESWDVFELELEIIIGASERDLVTNYVRPATERRLSFYEF